MLFSIHCLDKPGHAHVRQENRPAHVAYMMGFKDNIVLLGPLTSDDGTAMLGSLIVIDLPDRDSVTALLADDPYGKAGLFESVIVRGLRKVLPEG